MNRLKGRIGEAVDENTELKRINAYDVLERELAEGNYYIRIYVFIYLCIHCWVPEAVSVITDSVSLKGSSRCW